jgi:ankyrin repeat protein
MSGGARRFADARPSFLPGSCDLNVSRRKGRQIAWDWPRKGGVQAMKWVLIYIAIALFTVGGPAAGRAQTGGAQSKQPEQQKPAPVRNKPAPNRMRQPLKPVVANPKIGTSPAMAAAAAGNLDQLKPLLDSKSNVDAKNKEGDTPLMFAALHGRKDCVDALIAAHADIKARDKHGDTALQWAVHGGSIDCIQALIDAGADVKATNNDGVSPLMWAARLGDLDEVELLLKDGAGANSKNKDGENALVSAVCASWTYASDTNEGLWIMSPAQPNVYAGMYAVLVDIVAVLSAGKAPKHAAGWGAGDVPTVKCLIAAGADMNCRDALYGLTPLEAAIVRDNGDCADALMEAGADVNARDTFGETALVWSALKGDVKRVQALLAAKADINFKDKFGRSILMFAVAGDNADCVSALIAAGADVKAKDNKGFMARSYAKSDAVRALLSGEQASK